MNQREKAEIFQAMHKAEEAFLLPNCWDAITAKVLERVGFQAIATASAAISWSHGVSDGENLTRMQLLNVVGHIVRSVDIPVSVDIEKGYGQTPGEVGKMVDGIMDTGAVGINLEDSTKAGVQRPVPDMQARIAAAREVASRAGIALVINARVDAYLLGHSGESILKETIERGNAWLEAGADCIFVPGVDDKDIVQRLAKSIAGPINIIVLNANTQPLSVLSRWGVTRVSLGPRLMQSAVGHLEETARQVAVNGSFGFLANAPTFSQLNEWFESS